MRHLIYSYYDYQADILLPSPQDDGRSVCKTHILLYTDERVQTMEGTWRLGSAGGIHSILCDDAQQRFYEVWCWDASEVNRLDAELGFAVRAPRCLPSAAGVALMSHVEKQPATRH